MNLATETARRRAAQIADDIEAAATADFYAAAPPALAQQLGLRVARHGDATVVLAARLPSPMFNRVIGLGMRTPASTQDFDALLALYRAAGVRAWWLHWNPLAAPADFEVRLAARGFAAPARRAWAKFFRDAAPAPHVDTPLRVRAAGASEARATAAAIAAAYEMPPFMTDWIAAVHGRPRWHLVCVADGERVVGGGCLYAQGDCAWLGFGGVLTGDRKRGAQRALLALRIRLAIELGCRDMVTETGEPIADEPNPSFDNILRSGFVKVAARANYAAPVE